MEINKKIEQNFNNLVKDWEALKKDMKPQNYQKVLKDFEALHQDLKNMKF